MKFNSLIGLAAGTLLSSAAVTHAATTVTIGTVNNSDMIIMQKLSSKFEEENPDIKLDWVVLEENVLRQRLTTDIATGSGQFDVVTIGTYEVPIWGGKDWLVPLEGLPDDYDLDDVLQSIRDGLSHDGKLYALPFYAESSMTFLGPYPSGAPAIFADQASKIGASVAFIGCLGKDGFGDLILNRLRQDGVDVTGIARSDKLPTGTAFVTYEEDGGREFIFNIGNSAAALIDAGSVDPGLARDCRYFHVMGSSLGSAGAIAAVKRALELVKQSGGKVSFDPNIRPEILASAVIREAIALILEACDILLPSEADLRYFCGNVPESEAVASLFGAHPLEMIVVKNAVKGSVYYDRTRSLHVPAFKVTEVDPTGAGDCFGGTLVSCLAQDIDIERALTLANAAGALAVTIKGPMEGNSTLSELDRFIASAERQS